MRKEEQITLPEAARRLSISWERAWRALLKGELQGEKHEGRWYVDAASVAAYALRRDSNNGQDLAADVRPEGQ